jgi:Bacterial PH domain
VTERTTIRLHPPVILWWVWVAFLVLNVADYSLQGLPSARFSAVLAALLLLVTGLVYTLALRPKVIEDGDGLTVVNPYRVHRLPWPRIQSVDTGEWVRVHYARTALTKAVRADATTGAAKAGGTAGVVNCWALYVSTRARRKVVVGSAPPADGMSRRLRGLAAQPSGYAQPSPRLPDEARYLASLPVSAAIAARLNTRAQKERNRAEAKASATPKASAVAEVTDVTDVTEVADGVDGADGADGASAAATTWSWPALAAVAIPAVILLVVALL